MAVVDIDRRTVAALSKPSDAAAVYYDRRLTGFGLRVTKAGRVSYFVEFRPGAGGRRVAKRRIVLGRDAPPLFRADHARAAAEHYLAKVRLGADPAAERSQMRTAPTVREVLADYLDNRIARLRKPTTLTLYRGYARIHIEPEIGSKAAHLLTPADITALHRKVGLTHPVTANRVVVMLRAALAYAERQGVLPDRFANPATAVDRYRERLRERYLSADEFHKLGETLALAGTSGLPWHPDPTRKVKHAPKEESRRVLIDQYAIAAIRLLLLTGARLREILHLRWDQVDLARGVAVLPDSKTGRKVLVLGAPAVSVLEGLPRHGAFVIAGRQRRNEDGVLVDAPRADLNRPWSRIRKHAGLFDVRIHDLRHSFASVGASAGLGLFVVGSLLGHKSPATTTRYAHLADGPLNRASDLISTTIADALGLSRDR